MPQVYKSPGHGGLIEAAHCPLAMLGWIEPEAAPVEASTEWRTQPSSQSCETGALLNDILGRKRLMGSADSGFKSRAALASAI